MHLIDVIKKFPTKESCEEYLAALRWPDGIVCQHKSCGVIGNENFRKFTTNETTRMRFSKRQKKMVEVKVPSRNLYECKSCGYQFSATAGTIFHSTHLPIEKWFQAVAMILEAKKGMSALQICRHLGLPTPKGKKIPNGYRSIWFLCHRIREATKETGLLTGEVEADETYVGSRVRRPRHARPKTKQDDIVLGMVERGGGRLKLMPVPDTKAAILQPLLEKHISEQVATIYTDEHPIYIFALKSKFPGKHEMISHRHTYGIGDVHTNTIENAFSLFKRGLYGTFHQVSKKHLARYCDEFSYRFNRRESQSQMFEETVKGLLSGTPLTYKALTTSEKSES